MTHTAWQQHMGLACNHLYPCGQHAASKARSAQWQRSEALCTVSALEKISPLVRVAWHYWETREGFLPTKVSKCVCPTYQRTVIQPALCCCRMTRDAEHRSRVAVDQHAARLARGQAAATQDRLHSNAQQTQAELEAAQHAQCAQQIKALTAKPPPSLGVR